MAEGGMFDPGINIQAVDFGGDRIAISYLEARDVTPNVMEVHTLHIDPGLFEADIADVLDDLRDIVERAKIHKRNPPERIRAREPRE